MDNMTRSIYFPLVTWAILVAALWVQFQQIFN